MEKEKNNCFNCNCDVGLSFKKKRKFCSRKCQNTYNARKRRQEKSIIEYVDFCLSCGKAIEKPKRKFCCSLHKNRYNHEVRYKHKYTQAYVSRNPINFMKTLLNKKRRKEYGLTIEILSEIYDKQKGICAISGEIMTYSRLDGRTRSNISIDRIDSKKGYEQENIQLVCHIVNVMKLDMTDNEFNYWIGKIYEKQTEAKKTKLIK